MALRGANGVGGGQPRGTCRRVEAGERADHQGGTDSTDRIEVTDAPGLGGARFVVRFPAMV